MTDPNVLLNMIQELVEQDCVELIGGKVSDNHYNLNSQYITVYAEAMRMLAENGRMEIEYDDGGRYVSGRFN